VWAEQLDVRVLREVVKRHDPVGVRGNSDTPMIALHAGDGERLTALLAGRRLLGWHVDSAHRGSERSVCSADSDHR
jgi:metallophosphoesterase superfamily enzyme